MTTLVLEPVLVILCLIACSICSADDPIVQLPEGKIRGHILKSQNGSVYYAFQEIPFAAPPVGPNRFKEPQNPDPWDGILNTTENTKICSQDQTWGTLEPTEDCLYLNVFAPQNSENHLLPVYVWIHGGSFISGSAASFTNGSAIFMDYGIIVVTVNYRLGPFGFLNTMDGVIPGNLGLKDQRHALRWVKKNIGLFGGDPNQVTIGGESAGAFSVAYHLLSDNSEGLFRAAIQESGTSIARIGYTDKAKQFALQLGNILDKNINDQTSSADLLNFLLTAPASDILAAGSQVFDDKDKSLVFLLDITWCPVVENKNDSKDPFLTKPMYESFMTGSFHQVPLLTGYNSEEILLFLNGQNCSLGEVFDKDPSTLVSRKLNIADENSETVGTRLKEIYTNGSFSQDFAGCIKYSSDVTFQNPIVRQAECSSKFVPVYLYRFAFAGELAQIFYYPNKRPVIPGTEAVGHGEELAYLFQLDFIDTIPDSDLLTIQRVHTLWTNFIKYLNPTPGEDQLLENIIWPKVNASNIQFLNINATLEVLSNPRHYEEVNTLFQKYQQPPFLVW